MRRLCRAVCVVAIIECAYGFTRYRNFVPNGNNVPNTKAIGHTFAGGGGPCNEFGLAFMNHRSTWSEELCNLDSDGDGATNGEELGDPCCVWKFGDTPSRSTLLSHPGEPNNFTRAELDKLQCVKAPRDECACMSGNCTNGKCQGCNLVDDEGGYYCVPDVDAAGCYMMQYPYVWCGELP